MALFSDIDWAIILAVGAFLLLGPQSSGVLRQVGRYYGRFLRLKQEVLGEITQAADLPAPSSGGTLSFRGALLGYPEGSQTPGIPAAVAYAPTFVPAAASAAVGTIGPERWSLALPTGVVEVPTVR